VALRALASVNLAAVERNAARLAQRAAPAELCAVVKADGYGHGAASVARAAVAGGARRLAVATATEAEQLRQAGIEAPLMVMGAISSEELEPACRSGAELVAWTPEFAAAAARQAPTPVRLHVKLDSGMGRLGTRSAAEAMAVAEQIARDPRAELAGAMTHFASADEDPEFTGAQLKRFTAFAQRLQRLAPTARAHAANSAATLRHPEARLDMVRCGIALYGCDPMNRDPDDWQLEPALELTSYLAAIKRAEPGDSAGYGRRYIAPRGTWIGTVPIGYADGVRRDLTNNCEVLIGGRRVPLVGTVSMDNFTVDLGSDPSVRAGDQVTLIGRDGPERQTAEELASRLGTISYELLCGISARVPRAYHRDGQPL
jgi:alanine racemase